MSGVKKVERSRDALTVSGWLATVVLQHEIVQFRRKRAAISRSPGALTRGSNDSSLIECVETASGRRGRRSVISGEPSLGFDRSGGNGGFSVRSRGRSLGAIPRFVPGGVALNRPWDSPDRPRLRSGAGSRPAAASGGGWAGGVEAPSKGAAHSSDNPRRAPIGEPTQL